MPPFLFLALNISKQYLFSMKTLSIIPLLPVETLSEMNISSGPRNLVHIVVEQHGDPISHHSHYIAKCQNEYFNKEADGKSAAEALVNLAKLMHAAGFME